MEWEGSPDLGSVLKSMKRDWDGMEANLNGFDCILFKIFMFWQKYFLSNYSLNLKGKM